MIAPQMRPYYPTPLCMKDEDNLKIKSNYGVSADSFHIGYWMRYCLNTTDNSNWCKQKDDVDGWLRERSAIFLYEETIVVIDLGFMYFIFVCSGLFFSGIV